MKASEISINYKPLYKSSELKKISNSKDATDFLREVWSDRIQYVEEVYVLLLSRSNKIIGFVKISEGGTSGTVVDPKLIFQAALKTNASAIMLSHNHPSGNLKPSDTDIALTKQIIAAGKAIEIPVLDHIILTHEGYFSFADEGLM
jgi:DNA repair protein RadC